jgi:hypothetical protein
LQFAVDEVIEALAHAGSRPSRRSGGTFGATW